MTPPTALPRLCLSCLTSSWSEAGILLIWSGRCQYDTARHDAERTLGHIGHLVLAHGLESLSLERALGLWVDAEEVEVGAGQGKDAGKHREDLGNSHGDDRRRVR